ncbi:MAG: tetratricopeptide repeat protein [Ruminiclostridium sp.]|nr:tetratricopeptide repeat protein [Ruminiclostridium sp.]
MNIVDELERGLESLMAEPGNPQFYNAVGALLYQMKDWRNAEMYFQKAYELSPADKDILYNYASLLYVQPQLEKAIPIYKACLELYPDDRDTAEKLGDSYYRLGDYGLAAEMYGRLQKALKGEL